MPCSSPAFAHRHECAKDQWTLTLTSWPSRSSVELVRLEEAAPSEKGTCCAAPTLLTQQNARSAHRPRLLIGGTFKRAHGTLTLNPGLLQHILDAMAMQQGLP